MAVYQGARARTIVLPRRPRLGVDVPTLPRRRARAAVRARRRSSRLGLVLGGIVVTFVCAFFSLSQDVAVSAVSYEVDRLSLERERLLSQERDVASELNRLGKAPAIRKLAIDAGLGPLAEPLVLPAR